MNETYHHGNLRNDLIAAGLTMLCRDGFAGFSLRKLSQELGVSHAAAYRHFRNREELLGAIVAESSRMFRETLATAVSPGAGGREALLALGSSYVHFFLKNPEILTLFLLLRSEHNLMGLLFSGDPGNRSFPDRNAFEIFRSIAITARDLPAYRDLSERELLLGFWSKVHGLATILVSHHEFLKDEDLEAAIGRIIATPF
jgi:Transcriptional regulator